MCYKNRSKGNLRVCFRLLSFLVTHLYILDILKLKNTPRFKHTDKSVLDGFLSFELYSS